MLDFLAAHHIRLFSTDGQPLPPTAFATLRAVQKGETVRQHQETIRHADGTTLPVLVNAVAPGRRLLAGVPAEVGSHSTDPAEPVALVVYQDVSALKEAERLKDEFSSHWSSVASHERTMPAPTALVELDSDCISAANSSCAKEDVSGSSRLKGKAQPFL